MLLRICGITIQQYGLPGINGDFLWDIADKPVDLGERFRQTCVTSTKHEDAHLAFDRAKLAILRHLEPCWFRSQQIPLNHTEPH